MATPSPSRRRQRGVRVTVAGALLAFATLVVVLAVATQSAGWQSIASVTALLCGFAASRIMYNELLQNRREVAADRAAQARAYQALFIERANEHAEFSTAMTDRLASRECSIRELDAVVLIAEKRATEAETRVKRESRRANEAIELVAELQVALEIRNAEEADELASWESAGQRVGHIDGQLEGDAGTVVDLLAWEDRVNATSPSATGTSQPMTQPMTQRRRA